MTYTPAAALFVFATCVRDEAKSCLLAQFVMARIEAVAHPNPAWWIDSVVGSPTS
jgi:hypothetical protein